MPTRRNGSDRWDAADSVDYDEFARMLDFLIQPGVGGIGLFGTTGEGGTLTGPIAKFLDEDTTQKLLSEVKAQPGASPCPHCVRTIPCV